MNTRLLLSLLATTACSLVACKKSGTTPVPAPAGPTPVEVTLDAAKTYQTMAGFGGFGAQDVYWSGGPFTSPRFVSDLVTDLGCTIIRDELPTSFEIANDNADPDVTDLAAYNLDKPVPGHHAPFMDRVPHLKALRAAGVEMFITSVWSPAPWMKWNNRIDNGTPNNSAPPYNKNPTTASNQLKVENYAEFAELCVAYCRIFKREIGVDLYGLSVQNEPRFSQSYQSCVYDGEALRDVIKVVGRRFKKEGIATKLFLPEDVGWLDGVKSMTLPTLEDAEARSYVGIVATHGYALDGIAPASTDAATWQTMASWGKPYNLPLWMTETSGYKNTNEGAIALAKAMYTSLRFGNASAWVFWSLSTGNLDEYSLMDSKGGKSKRYYVSKQYYRYVRPGAVRVETATADADLLPLAFVKDGLPTLVITNVGNAEKAIRVKGDGASAQYKVFRTSPSENCKEIATVKTGDSVAIPAQAVVTLVGVK